MRSLIEETQEKEQVSSVDELALKHTEMIIQDLSKHLEMDL